MEKIKLNNRSVKVSGMYYTEIRSMHYDKDKKILRITHMSDRCSDEEFLNYAYEYLPELKEKKLNKFMMIIKNGFVIGMWVNLRAELL